MPEVTQNINGGEHHHYYQAELSLKQSKTHNISLKTTDAQYRFFVAEAKRRNVAVGALIRRAAIKQLRQEPHLKALAQVLDEIVD